MVPDLLVSERAPSFFLLVPAVQEIIPVMVPKIECGAISVTLLTVPVFIISSTILLLLRAFVVHLFFSGANVDICCGTECAYGSVTRRSLRVPDGGSGTGTLRVRVL